MEIKVKWSAQANLGLIKVLEYLSEEWTSKEIKNLQIAIEDAIKNIKRFPELFPASKSNPNLRKAIIDKNNYMIYKVDRETKTIFIINFRGTKQRPL